MKSLIPALFVVGAVMVLFGSAVYITGWEFAPYIYTCLLYTSPSPRDA